MENASPRGFILCACGKHRYASTDSHGSCMHCLGLEHAMTSVSERGKCPHCAKFQRRACHKRLSKVRKFLNQMTSDKKTIPPDPKPLKPVVSTPAKVTLPTVMKKSLQTDAPSQPSMVLFSSLSTATSTLTPQSSTIPMVFTIRSPASTSSVQHVAPAHEPKRENNTGTERHSSNSGSKSHSHRGSHKRRHSSERRSRHFRQSQHARRSHGLSHACSNSPSSSYTSYSSSSDCFSPKKENSSRLLARFSDMLKKQREQLLDVMHLQLQALQQSMQAQRDSMEQRVEALEKKQKKFLSAPSVMQTQSLGSTQDTDFAHDDTFRPEAEPTCKDWSGSTASMDSDTITVKIEEDPISIVSGYDIEEEGDDEDNGDSEDASLLPDVTPSMQELLLADDLQSLICRAAEYLGIDFPAVPGRLIAPDPTMVPEFENLVQSTWSNPASSRPFKEVHSKMYSLHECQAPAYDRMPLVVGLGNPGMGSTRHSVGMAVLGALAGRLGVAEHWRVDRQVSGELVLSEQEGVQLVLLKPHLLMNINGASVAKAAEKFKIMPEDIYLIHDELDKPLGKFAMKQGGSARGHNGVRSCMDCLKTDVMPRMRIGIGRPAGKVSVERHVLGRFSREEQELVRAVLEQSAELLLQHITASSSEGTGAQGMTLPQGGRVTAKT